MIKVECNTPAPGFALPDVAGNMVALEDFRGRKNVLLVFNRGLF